MNLAMIKTAIMNKVLTREAMIAKVLTEKVNGNSEKVIFFVCRQKQRGFVYKLF